ncbi:energy-coupling factor transporter ATP-binding protein EcfA2 [Catenulispora sp. GP43]|uniref:NACHT domain-containing protein n=1 Tax=Catenulispora sp. GP43 TaxID=3156263 RepID=UPI003514AE78
MRRSLRYTDAVKVLAGGENQLVKLIDEASAAMLLGAGVFDLFEARQQALRLLEKALDKFGEKLRGLDRLTRTERIHAAHEIIRITAYFDAFGAAMAEFHNAATVRFSASQEVALTAGSEPDPGWRALFQELCRKENYGSPLWDNTSVAIFAKMAADSQRFLTGLALWDELTATEHDRLSTLLKEQVPAEAAARYQENLRRLSAECPEFGVWVNLQAHAASREQLAAGLAGLETLLAPLTAGYPAHQQEALARAYRAGLAKPILLTSGPDSHLTLPSLGEGYVDHSFRLAFGRLPTSLSWDRHDLRHDLPALLGTYLMSEYALSTPLLILGQPGSGKSVLTRILAARLPAEHFLPIRVELRRVNAEADLQDHIESAIREQTGENVQWTRFATADPALTPVVILDGFDELLQATGVAQTDFLQRIERFQERELDQGRSVAVIVTSRTAVAGRATLPSDMPIIRLEPFDDAQIVAWIDIWNRANSATLANRSMLPLSAPTILRYRTLAEQPLLLLMLALYDATDNALTAVAPGLSQSAVYEQLLKDFARRELTKDPDISDLDRRIEVELLRLSIVAFSMFNRGAQWIDADSLTEDLRALGIWEAERNQNTFRSTLSAGQQMVGRFFFIHNVQATRDGGELQTYEFLHATFSEYLIARLVVRLLAELAAQHLASTYAVSRAVNDAMLYALLSFDCLAARAPIVEYIGELIAHHAPAMRGAMTDIIVKLFHGSLMARTDHTYADYQPVAAEVVTRASCWNANLFLLLALTRDRVSLRELFPEKGNGAVYEWHRLSNLWRSCVRGEGWNGLADALAVERVWHGDGRDIIVRVGPAVVPAAKPDMKWSYNIPDVPWPDGGRWESHSHDELARRANFLMDRRMDVAMHNMMAVADALPTLGNALYNTKDGRLVTATALLTTAFVAPYLPEPADEAIIELARSLPRLKAKFKHETELYDKLALSVFTTAVELDSLTAGAREELLALLLSDAVFTARDPQVVRLHERLENLLIASLPVAEPTRAIEAAPATAPAPVTAPTPPTLALSPAPGPSPAASSPATPARPPAVP